MMSYARNCRAQRSFWSGVHTKTKPSYGRGQDFGYVGTNEEGVLKIGSNGTRNRRAYKLLRIPESIAERVHPRLTAGC